MPDPFADIPNPTPRELAWHGAAFTLPEHWEIFRFTKRPEKGQLHFQTRAGLEAILNWRRVAEPPDLARIMNEVHRRALAGRPDADAGAFTRLTTEKIGAFTLGYHRDGEPAQAAAYLPEGRLLLEWMFPVDRRAARVGQWIPMLRSFRPNLGAERRWALFGLGATLPDTYALEDVAAYPANVVFQFTGPNRAFVNLRRWGLPDHVRGGLSLANYYRSVLRQLRNRVVAVEETTLHATAARGAAYPAAVIDFERRGEVAMDKLVGRLWTGQGVCWEDPAERRIYAFEQFGPPKAERLRPADVCGVRPVQ